MLPFTLSPGDDGFHEKDDAAYCKTCYFEQFAPKCGGCNTPITGKQYTMNLLITCSGLYLNSPTMCLENYISSLNLQWHPNCFVCKVIQSACYYISSNNNNFCPGVPASLPRR